MDEVIWLTVASVTEIEPGAMLGTQAGGKNVAIYNVEGAYFATDNICTHAYAHLTDGWFEGNVIECPLHGGQFDVTTGKGMGAPITCDLKTFATRVVDDAIQVCVADSVKSA